jgi:ATP-binding cassette, subfamily F, member 2
MSSVSKQKRLAKKAAKSAKKPEETPAVNGSSANKEVTDLAAAANGLSLETRKISSERTATGVLASQPRSRDIKIEQYSLSFYGRVLIDNATIELNFGRRYV